jgi:SAM-dependent methyltransferase
MKATRHFNWVSSIRGDSQVLEDLNSELYHFYSDIEKRKEYQGMLDSQEENPKEDSAIIYFISHLLSLKPESVLEVGAGGGRVYRLLEKYGYKKKYTGTETGLHQIEMLKRKHSKPEWVQGTAYNMPFADETFDLCYSVFVLEHLVYPENALNEMLRVIKPGGDLLLMFPDFVQMGRFPSQMLGFSPLLRAVEKLWKWRWIDALLSIYDSRVRLPKALKEAVNACGPFPINLSPICLSYPDYMMPDVDAVYIASKEEIKNWAEKQGLKIKFPCGIEGSWREEAFIQIKK